MTVKETQEIEEHFQKAQKLLQKFMKTEDMETKKAYLNISISHFSEVHRLLK